MEFRSKYRSGYGIPGSDKWLWIVLITFHLIALPCALTRDMVNARKCIYKRAFVKCWSGYKSQTLTCIYGITHSLSNGNGTWNYYILTPLRDYLLLFASLSKTFWFANHPLFRLRKGDGNFFFSNPALMPFHFSPIWICTVLYCPFDIQRLSINDLSTLAAAWSHIKSCWYVTMVLSPPYIII